MNAIGPGTRAAAILIACAALPLAAAFLTPGDVLAQGAPPTSAPRPAAPPETEAPPPIEPLVGPPIQRIQTASALSKATSGDPAALPAARALGMATIGGARALGLDAAIGSLAPGKQADMIAVDLGSLDATPCYDPVSHLVHAVGREAVTDVWVAGRRVVEDRILTSADEASIVARAIAWQERLQ